MDNIVGLTSYNYSSSRKTRSISEPTRTVKENEVNNKIQNNDVQLITQLKSKLKIHLSNKLTTTHLISSFNVIKTNHQKCNKSVNNQNEDNHLKICNHKIASRSAREYSNLMLNSFLLVILIFNFIISTTNQVNAKSTDDGAFTSQSTLFFTNNLPFKIAFYNTTGTILNCPIASKSSIYWFAIGLHSSNNLNNLNLKSNYRYPFNFINQHWSISNNGHFRTHFAPQPPTTNQPTQNTNLIDNILASNPELSPVVDLHNVIYTRNDGALVFPPFYANDLQPTIHNRKYRCLAINEHGALLSNEIQIKARKFFSFKIFLFCYVLVLKREKT